MTKALPTIRTDAEIDEDWRALVAMRPHIPHFGKYRHDNWLDIDAMVQTLRYGLTEAEVKKLWPVLPDGTAPDVWSAAEDARYWMDGGEIMSPSESWAGSVVTPRPSTGAGEISLGSTHSPEIAGNKK